MVKSFAEVYAVKMIKDGDSQALIALGADNRGVLYAAGEILRQTEPKETGIVFKVVDVSTAPAYRFRGANATQGGTMRKYTKARPWTKDELHEAILDLALAYGRVTKFNKPRPEWKSLPGGRVIVLKEGERKFKTWIRDKDGKKEFELLFPDVFVSE